jgi:hypothetical protein
MGSRKPAGNQLFVFRFGLRGAVLAKVVIFAVEGDDCLAGGFVAAKRIPEIV